MENTVNDRLQDLAEKRLWKTKLEKDLVSVVEKLTQQQELFESLEETLRQEKQDVEQLEKLSLKALFATMLGSKEEQIQKERQEVLVAEMQYHAAKRMVNALQVDRDHLVEQLSQLQNIEADYQNLLKQKEQMILSEGHKNATEILDMGLRLAQTRTEVRELAEAIQAGAAVRDGLELVLTSLNSASNWGTWDMLGGGLISTVIKHDHMDTAREASDRVKTQLITFQRELADLSQFEDLTIEVEPLERFADLWLDGLLFDWMVQSKIIRSREHAQSAFHQVEKVLQTLEARLTVAKGTFQNLKNRQTNLIEKS